MVPLVHCRPPKMGAALMGAMEGLGDMIDIGTIGFTQGPRRNSKTAFAPLLTPISS